MILRVRAILKRLRPLLCMIVFHKLVLQKHIKGNHKHQTWVVCLRCTRCGGRYIVAEVHQAFLRYDDDPVFKADILRIYENVQANEL